MEIQGLNSELNEMLMRGQLSGKKIAELVHLKEYVDRLASTNYIAGKEMASLKDKFGVEPAIQTWGDYFQTELASQYFDLSDLDFEKIVQTVRFDLISSIKIFSEKSNEFNQTVYENGITVYGMNKDDWDEDQQEAAHLYILLQYFKDMGLKKENIELKDEIWFDTFVRDSTTRQAI